MINVNSPLVGGAQEKETEKGSLGAVGECRLGLSCVDLTSLLQYQKVLGRYSFTMVFASDL